MLDLDTGFRQMAQPIARKLLLFLTYLRALTILIP
jgi:hypothetical protein